MINPDGSISIAIKPEHMTWYVFLNESRVVNHANGGWNANNLGDGWLERGLNRLADHPFLQQWTSNFLNPGARPAPRDMDFQLDRTPSPPRLHLPSLTRNNLATSNEHALNWSLYRGSDWNPMAPLHGTRMLGYEIPLGNLRVDLLGISPQDETPSLRIIELKQGNNVGDSPLMALTEALCYGLQALRCREDIEGELSALAGGGYVNFAGVNFANIGQQFFHDSFQKIKLTLAAPTQYWTYWNYLSQIKPEFNPLINSVNQSRALGETKFSIDCLNLTGDHLLN